MEIEVEVWQAMALQGQQSPIAPLAAPAAPDELQGVSSLSEDSVGGPHPIPRTLALAPLQDISSFSSRLLEGNHVLLV
jgi:hypothetical protein